MGVFDSFIDKGIEIQLKNFDKCLGHFRVGDEVPMGRFGYPSSGLFFCGMNPNLGVVIIEKGIFKGIETVDLEKTMDKFPKFRIWDCVGNEYKRKEKT